MKLGDLVEVYGLDGVVILNPKHKRQILISFFGAGVFYVKRKDVKIMRMNRRRFYGN